MRGFGCGVKVNCTRVSRGTNERYLLGSTWQVRFPPDFIPASASCGTGCGLVIPPSISYFQHNSAT